MKQVKRSRAWAGPLLGMLGGIGLVLAIAAGDVSLTAIQAHALKGGASNFCAGRFVAAALRLELHAKSGSLDGAEQMMADMTARLDEVREVVAAVNWDEIARNWQG